MSNANSNTLTVTIGEATVTLKPFEAKSGNVTFRAVAGGRKVASARIPAAALQSLAGQTVKSGRVSGTLEFVSERPENAKGRKTDEHGNPIPWIPRTNCTIDVPFGDEVVGITVEAKQEGVNAETAMLTVSGKFRSDGVGGGGRKAAPTVSLDAAFAAFGS